MSIFGRNTARQRLRRAARESLKIPAFNAPVDCTPWVTGGLWPAELSIVTAETAPLVKYLKADLERIVNSANEDLKAIRFAGLADSIRQAEEARVINEARAFAVRRVESTIRHLHPRSSKAGTERQPWHGGGDFDGTPRYRHTDPRPDLKPYTGIPTSNSTARYRVAPPPPIGQLGQVAPAQPAKQWKSIEEPEHGERVAKLPVSTRTEVEQREPEQPTRAWDSDDTEVLGALTALLQEIAPLAVSPVELSTQTPNAPRPDSPAAKTQAAETPRRQAPAVIEETKLTRSATAESDRRRLEALLRFVARQEPNLHWAVGRREDGRTLLVTDLAHGWIPPGLHLPADIKLLEPSRSIGTVEALLGRTVISAVYSPGDSLSWATDYEVPDTSSRPCELPAIDDLGWVLSEATHWRDGLPPMVNTLTKAAAAGTGILEAEMDMLRTHLHTLRYQLLSQYPDVDAGLLLNCLLLAAAESIATSDQLHANYHLAWFQTLSAPWASG